MTASRHVEVRRGAYADSVALMAASRTVAALDGVDAALVAMATDLNRELAVGMGFDVPGGTGPNDLLVAVGVEREDVLPDALATLAAALAPRRTSAGSAQEEAPRTTGAAVRRSEASLVLVSVPGRLAFVEAMDALDAGASVMVFSDNVPVEQEVALKDAGAARGLLVMGPDCGTAVVGGVGLGFANAVQPGPVSLVAASGTGAQQLMCLLDAAGVGVRHCLGVGGRDLSEAVAARSTLQALDLLAADAATELVLLVSKPPADAVAQAVRAGAEAHRAPVVLALLGPGAPDLTEAAAEVCRRLGRELTLPDPVGEVPASPLPRGSSLRGLFAGGTLCDEAMAIAADRLGPVRSNIPLEPAWELPDNLRDPGHVMIDFGDDRLTRGRPHPMIDQGARIERLLAEGDETSAGVLLLDVVLGHGAHPDPAAELAPAIAEARRRAESAGRSLAVVVSLCGTDADPQGVDRQAAALAEAGAVVHRSNAQAARTAVDLVETS